MIIKLYKNMSDNNHVDKNIGSALYELDGYLRDSCDILNPIITVQCLTKDSTINDFTRCNYCYIEDFGRYYYINDIVINGKVFELHMHVDVLMSYKDEIRANSAVVSRQENKYNLYLQDGVFKTYANPHIQVAQFPNGFTDFNFIFSVSG